MQAVERALLENKRRILVAMATGSGKTRMTVALLARLLQAGFIRRALFLVDRDALAEQAVNDGFSPFNITPDLKFRDVYAVERAIGGELPPSNVKVVVAALQTMCPLIERAKFPIDEFDCVISDECHRSIYGDWMSVVRHFDAIQIGLTATPATHTVAYFGEPVYSYGYHEAVSQKWLVPYQDVRILTGVTMQGLTYQGEDFLPTELERDITVPDRNRKIVQEYQKYATPEQFGIVFSINSYHANQLCDLFNQAYPEFDGKFAKVIMYDTDYAREAVRRFALRPGDFPRVAVTVDMLSTGVDKPLVENLVFVRPTRSRILFEQMCGRGTRLCHDIGKTHFTRFDCVGVIEYHQHHSDFGVYRPQKESHDPPQPPPPPKPIVVADDVLDEVVVSQLVFSLADGTTINREDYLAAFAKWVKANKGKIAQVRYLLEGKALTVEDEQKLLAKLATTSYQFTEAKLQSAFRRSDVDLNGFLLSVLRGGEPQTREQRRSAAFDEWLNTRKLNHDQREFAQLMRDHLTVHSTFTLPDLQEPPFNLRGGYHRAAQLFGEARLPALIQEVTGEVAKAN